MPSNNKQQSKNTEKKVSTNPSESEKHVVAERFHTKMCRNFMATGQCPYHGKCMFAHGADELRTKEMNLRDGLTSEEAIRNWKRMMVLKAEARARLQQLQEYRTQPYDSSNSSDLGYMPQYHQTMMGPYHSAPNYVSQQEEYERSASMSTDGDESVDTHKSAGSINGYPYKGNPKVTVHDPYAASVLNMAP